MQCQACEYENPREARFCAECGAGLRWNARKRAEGRFRGEIATARNAAKVRLKRAEIPWGLPWETARPSGD